MFLLIHDDIQGNVLKVRLLGANIVSFNGQKLVTKYTRNSKKIQLFKYFLCNPNRLISQQTLIEDLELENNDTAIITLKNIVYRLRKLLINAGMDKKIISYRKSSYGFFCTDKIILDMDISIIDKKYNDLDKYPEDYYSNYMEIIDLYKGGFIWKPTYSLWENSFNVQYKRIYIDVLKKVYDISKTDTQKERLLKKLELAIEIHPYEEDIILLYLQSLYDNHHQKQAIREYDRIVAKLYNEVGISPSIKMDKMLQKLTDYKNNSTNDIADIGVNIAEIENEKGAYFCNLGGFSNIYQFTVRNMQRSEKATYIMLCTIYKIGNIEVETGKELDLIVDNFHKTIMDTCRSCDAYTRYSANQFLIMFQTDINSDMQTIARRIRTRFYKSTKMEEIIIDFKIISSLDLQELVDKYD